MKFEYLDHTADIQFHACKPIIFIEGGDSLKEAFENTVLCMFNYMTDIKTIQLAHQQNISVQAHDMESLLFKFMDECLFLFSGDYFLVGKIQISLFDLKNFSIEAEVFGEEWNNQRHPRGTEIKAITYSNMKIYDEPNRHEVYLIVDI